MLRNASQQCASVGLSIWLLGPAGAQCAQHLRLDARACEGGRRWPVPHGVHVYGGHARRAVRWPGGPRAYGATFSCCCRILSITAGPSVPYTVPNCWTCCETYFVCCTSWTCLIRVLIGHCYLVTASTASRSAAPAAGVERAANGARGAGRCGSMRRRRAASRTAACAPR